MAQWIVLHQLGTEKRFLGINAEDHPRRYTRITLTHYGSGPLVTEAALARAAELSRTKYCSVSVSLNAEILDKVVVEPWEDLESDQH